MYVLFSKESEKGQGNCCGEEFHFSANLWVRQMLQQIYWDPAAQKQRCSQTVVNHVMHSSADIWKKETAPASYYKQHFDSLRKSYFGTLDSLQFVKQNGNSDVLFILSYESFWPFSWERLAADLLMTASVSVCSWAGFCWCPRAPHSPGCSCRIRSSIGECPAHCMVRKVGCEQGWEMDPQSALL